MKKFLVLFLFLGAIGVASWEFYSYSGSGEAIFSRPVQREAGRIDKIYLTPAMTPVRVFLKVGYRIHIQDETNDAYSYVLNVINPLGENLIDSKSTHSVKRDDQGSSYEETTLNHIVDTVDVVTAGDYSLEWSVQPRKAKIKTIEIALRQNVRAINIPVMAFAGGCFILGWIVIFSGIRNRRRLR